MGEKNLFRIHVNVTLGDLKHKLTQLNGCVHHRDQRRVTDVEYRRLSVCSDGTVESICYNLIRLRTFNEIAACMVQPEKEDEAEPINLSDF
ncbi:hypothetical protein QL285_037674 [Trifolium repens]|nr:hypothetical protein QL285_037674 [Trifolium repens]